MASDDAGEFVGEAALDAIAHVGEHYDSGYEIVGCIVTVLLRGPDGELEAHTHTSL